MSRLIINVRTINPTNNIFCLILQDCWLIGCIQPRFIWHFIHKNDCPLARFRYLSLLCLFAWVGGTLSAQTDGKTLPELWDVYRSATNDSTRVMALAAVASGYLATDRDSATLLVNQALTQARSLKIKTAEANALVCIGQAYDMNGDLPNALKNINQALAIFKGMKDTKGMAAAYNARGLAYFYANKIDDALKEFEIAHKTATNAGNLVYLSKAQHNLGMTYAAKNEIKTALNYYLLARNLKDSLVNLNAEGITALDQVSTYTMLGSFYMDLYQFEKARESMKAAVELTPDSEIRRKVVTIFNLGTVEELDSNFLEAKKLYEQSLELAIRGDFPIIQISIYTGLGQIANDLNAKEQAATYYNQAKLILEKYPNPRLETNLLGNEGKYFNSIKAYDKAKQNGLRALATAEAVQSERHILYAYKVLTEAFEGLQDWPAAAHYARKYIDLKEKLDSGRRKQEVVGLQAAMDVERATVRYEKKLKDQELAISQKWIFWLQGALALALLFAVAAAFGYFRVRKTNTQLTAARGELQDSNFQLVKTNQLLTMANTKLQQFAFATGHDLKESLRNITSFTQLAAIEMAENVPSAQGHLQEATASSKRMRKMLDDLLHFSNISGSDTTVANIPVQEVVSSVKQQLKAEIEAAQGDVHITTAAIVKANRGEMEQIFFNLIHNALRYRAADTPARITIKMEKAADGQPVFKVTDNGIGIPEQERENIFKPFHRLHNRSQSGSGLGLSICRDIVHAYNGRIWHEPAPNGGSVFCFTIPKAEPKG